MIQRPVPEGLEVPVEFGTDAAHLALADPAADAERLHEIIDLAGGDAMHVGLHHHREQGAVDPSSPLQQRRKERSLAQLGDLELDVARYVDNRRARCPLRCAVRVSVR